MTQNTPSSLAVICAENIALLYLLHSVPVRPFPNPVDSLPIRQKGYTLSFLQERSLANTLAYLSNLKDGPDHIPAVCVEEVPDSAVLNVLVAVNKVRPSDGNNVLQNLKLGFERIFALLSQVSDDDCSPVIESRIFTEIISMCSPRILCRLRFISNSRNTPRQPIKELLQETIIAIRWLEKEPVQDNRLHPLCGSFVERAKAVIRLADAWTKHRTPAQLVGLVEGVYRLWQVGELQDLLNNLPNRIMSPASRKNLLNTVSKVARYREAARFLYRTAMKVPLVRQMRIVLVNPPQNAFQKIPANQCNVSLLSTISRIRALHGQPWDLGQFCRLLNISEEDAVDRFAQQTRKTLKDAKIHAEIQLLFYCELKASRLPPRVVCSAKDACFLCNTFIRMYGKIHIPRCHGRLYPGWRLPFSPRLKEMEQRFNNELANQIKNSFTTLLSRQQKTVYPDPAESTLLTLPLSVSTLCSLVPPESDIKEDGEASQPKRPNRPETDEIPVILSNAKALSKSLESTLSASPKAGIGELSIQASNDIASQTLASTISSSQGPSDSNLTSLESFTLLQGEILAKSVKADHASPLYIAGPLEVQIEYATGPSQMKSTSRPGNLCYSIEWLTVNEAEGVLEQNTSSSVNAESIVGEVSHKLDDQNCFYITARGSVIKIVLLSSDTGINSAP